MEEGHNGLGFAVPIIVDPRFAPRGDQFTNAHQEDELRRQRDGWEDFRGDDEEPSISMPTIDMNTEIPDSNVGFKLLQKMGWSRGKGLGRNENGIVEPIRTGVDAGIRLGLGKQEEDDHFTAAELVERRRLETEIQANEDEDRKKRREAQAEREQKIRVEVTEIKKTFFCEWCHKQYEKAMEFEQHLSSYDHHHKKRLVEMRQMQSDRTKEERARKEARAMEKEMAKLAQQAERAKGGAGPAPPPPPPPADSGQPPLPAGQPPAAPPPPPPEPLQPGTVGSLSLSFGMSKPVGLGGRGGPAARGGGRIGAAGRGGLAGRGRGLAAAPLAGFGASDSEEEGGS